MYTFETVRIVVFFFFKQKTAYEIYQCDWSSDVCSSDLMEDKISLREAKVKNKVKITKDETEENQGEIIEDGKE